MKQFFLLIMLALLMPLCMSASSPRMVFVEEVTSANCGTCAYLNVDFNNYLAGNKDRVIPVIFHSGNSYAEPMYDFNQTMLGPRIWGNYVSGTLGTPAAWVNGTKLTSLPLIGDEVNKYSGQSSPVSVWVFEERNGTKVQVSLIVQTDQQLDANTKLAAVICEEHLFFDHAGSNGEKDFYWVARAMAPSADKTQALALNTLKPGAKTTYTFSYDMNPAWTPANIYVVAFIQNYQTKEVLQCGKTLPNSMAVPKIAIGSGGSSSVDFGDVSNDLEKTVTITNDGLALLNITSVSIENDANHAFDLTDADVTGLYPGGTKDLKVLFTPKDNKQFTASLVIKTNDPTKGTFTIPLSGQGSGVEVAPKIRLSMTNIDFGVTGSNLTEYVTITNKGLLDLNIQSVAFTNDPDGVFSLIDQTYPVLKPDSSYRMGIKFSPLDNKYYTAKMVITTNATNNPQASVDLTGQGSGVSSKNHIASDLSTLDYGKVSTTKSLSVKLTNSGYGDLELTSIRVVDDANSVYKITQNMEITLNHGDNAEIIIKFTPKANKVYTARLKVVSTADNEPEKYIPLSGEGEGFVAVEDPASKPLLTINGNPAGNMLCFTLSSQLAGKSITVDLYDGDGKLCKNLFSGIATGDMLISGETAGLSQGKYFIVLNQERQRSQYPVIIAR